MTTTEEYLGSESWVEKVGKHFDTLDTNSNGFLTQENWICWVDNIKKNATLTEQQETNLRSLYIKVANRMGATGPGVEISREQFIKTSAEFISNREEAMSFFRESNKAWFEILDSNKDGMLDLDEYTKMMEAGNQKPEMAKMIFDFIDQDKDGKIQLEEMDAATEQFWFSTEPNF